MDKFQKYLGLVADIIGVLTFILSFFSLSKPSNTIWVEAFGAPLSTFRFLFSALLLFSSSYALSRVFGRLISQFYTSDKQLRILFYGIISAVSAWITIFVFQFFLYGPALNYNRLYRIGFTILVILSCLLSRYFLSLSIEHHAQHKDEFENEFTLFLVFLYVIFWFVPALSPLSLQ